MIRIREAILVEGKYDKIKLSSIIDGFILETHGFRIFKDKEQMKLIRKMAETRGLVILTDSDAAGFVIRNYLAGSIPPEKIKHAYVPALSGKERRKARPSKEGKLGVEGVPAESILQALRRAGATIEGESEQEKLSSGPSVTKQDLFEWGLSGGPDSALRRSMLLKELGLPEYVSANALVRVLNSMMSYEEVREMVKRLGDPVASREEKSKKKESHFFERRT